MKRAGTVVERASASDESVLARARVELRGYGDAFGLLLWVLGIGIGQCLDTRPWSRGAISVETPNETPVLSLRFVLRASDFVQVLHHPSR